jgi:hypothetical protein
VRYGGWSFLVWCWLYFLGEKHDLLKDDDFAIGFMNSTMRDKLLNFNNIICMDGTHCTNKKGMDLTIMLVKDDRNAGFPVAFFLSNRLDTQIQEIFFRSTPERNWTEPGTTIFYDR